MVQKIFLSLLLCLTGISFSQAKLLNGVIKDQHGNPVAYANVMIVDAIDSTLVAGVISCDNGAFSINAPNKAGVLLKITSVGYDTKYIACCNCENVEIMLRENSTMLGEVVVKSQLPSYKLTAEGLKTQIEGTILSRLGTGEDVLKNIAGLQKDKDGNIVVLGKGTPIIYINGRMMRDKSELDQMKSSDIKSVELISNPGARYDASVRAVLKIKTRALRGEGLGFDARSTYKQNTRADFVEQLNWNYHHKKLDVFGTHYYSNSKFDGVNKLFTDTYADTLWHIENEMHFKSHVQSISNIAGFNFSFSDEHSIGARYTLEVSPEEPQNIVLKSTVLANNTFYDQLENSIYSKEENKPAHYLNAYYHGKVKQNEIDFNFDMVAENNNEKQFYDERSEKKDSRTLSSTSTNKNMMMASKLTLSRSLWGGEILMGGEHISTIVNSDYINPEGVIKNSFSKLKSQQVSGFVQYNLSSKIGQLSAGLRLEYVNFDYFDNGTHIDEQSRTFGNVFPSVTYGTKIKSMQLQLNYAAHTSRPSYRQLSNNVIYANRFTMQSGNPKLKYEIIHNLGISGVWKFLQFSLEYNDKRNAIIFWSEQMNDNPAVSKLVYKNVNSLKNVMSSVSIAPKVGIWSPQLSVQVSKQWFTLKTGIREYKLNRPLFSAQFNNNFNFQHGWTASMGLYFTGKGDSENMYNTRNVLSHDLSLTKSFLNNDLTMQLQISDIFKKPTYGYLLHNGQMNSLNLNTNDSREVSITVRYKFNMGKNKYKGTGAGNSEKSRL